ncbi:MAG: helix-turn-helix transcriptional regulator [Bdellovibrionota bacterium]
MQQKKNILKESNIGNFIRARRKERNLTQKQLAEFAGVSFTFLNRVENGDLDIKVSVLNKVLLVFHCCAGAMPMERETDEEEELND